MNKSFSAFIQSWQTRSLCAACGVFSTCSSIQGSAVQSYLKVSSECVAPGAFWQVCSGLPASFLLHLVVSSLWSRIFPQLTILSSCWGEKKLSSSFLQKFYLVLWAAVRTRKPFPLCCSHVLQAKHKLQHANSKLNK